jgi:hypothetical protein
MKLADLERLHYRADIVHRADGSPLTIADRYVEEHKKVFGAATKPDVSDVLRLAQWTLEHGYVSKYTELMDDLAGSTKDDKIVSTYLDVRQKLSLPVKDAGPTVEQANLQKKFGLKRTSRPSDHYVLYHQAASEESAEVVARLEKMERNLRSFYYWFAMKGISLSMPTERLSSVLTAKADDFHGLHEVLTSSPVISDGFMARRENLSVLSSRRLDDPYRVLEELSNPLWADGLNRNEVLKKAPSGPGMTRDKIFSSQAMALLLKVMETDSERTSISHDATRQLVYGAGLLPRNVVTPEWVQYGMGSFFETPLWSPWTSTGAPSMENLPNFKDYQRLKRLEKTSSETLRKVVTDAYFRESAKTKDPALERKARATAWALTYFLMQTRPEGMLRYYKELSKQPRDVELDEDTLMGCFARAFDLVDSSNKNIDTKRLDLLGTQWYTFIGNTTLEMNQEMDAIRKFISEVTTGAQDATHGGPGGGAGPGGPGAGPGPGTGGPGSGRGGAPGVPGAGTGGRGGNGPGAPPAPPGGPGRQQ